MLIRTLAAAISAPIRLASDNLIAERGGRKSPNGKSLKEKLSIYSDGNARLT